MRAPQPQPNAPKGCGVPVEAGQVRIFSKSGRRVRLIGVSDYGLWECERVDGRSRKKRMLCPEASLV